MILAITARTPLSGEVGLSDPKTATPVLHSLAYPDGTNEFWKLGSFERASLEFKVHRKALERDRIEQSITTPRGLITWLQS